MGTGTVSQLAVAAVFVAIGLASIAGALATRTINVDDPLGPMFLPVLCGALVVLGSLAVTARTWRRRDDALPGVAWTSGRELLAGGLILLYIAVFPFVPFVSSTMLMLVASLRVAGMRDWRTVLGIAAVATVALYYGFDAGMGTPLP